MKNREIDDADFDAIVKILENTKEFCMICMPLLYTPAQLVTTKLIEFFQRGSRVVWSNSDIGVRRVEIYYYDTKEKGNCLQGVMPEENWDEIAFHFFQNELTLLMSELDQGQIKPESEKILFEILDKANDIWPNSATKTH